MSGLVTARPPVGVGILPRRPPAAGRSRGRSSIGRVASPGHLFQADCYDQRAVHVEGRQREALGHDMIFLSIGEPDAAPPRAILDEAYKQMLARRLRYSPGNGEPSVVNALSRHYTKQTGREITPQQFLFLPGTQTALYMAFISILNEGDEVLLLDPYYATYEGVIRGPGGIPVPVPLDPDRYFPRRR